jgi:hypothetical protein
MREGAATTPGCREGAASWRGCALGASGSVPGGCAREQGKAGRERRGVREESADERGREPLPTCAMAAVELARVVAAPRRVTCARWGRSPWPPRAGERAPAPGPLVVAAPLRGTRACAAACWDRSNRGRAAAPTQGPGRRAARPCRQCPRRPRRQAAAERWGGAAGGRPCSLEELLVGGSAAVAGRREAAPEREG